MSFSTIFSEVHKERLNQELKWGEQNHPDGTGPDLYVALLGLSERVRDSARDACDAEHKAGKGTWQSIAMEEFTEALAESDPVELRKELIQSIAVQVAWVECIDRRS